MKAKDWYKQKRDFPDPRGNPIICPDCGNIVAYDREIMFMVLQPPGLVCPICDEIVIHSPQIYCGVDNFTDVVSKTYNNWSEQRPQYDYERFKDIGLDLRMPQRKLYVTYLPDIDCIKMEYKE